MKKRLKKLRKQQNDVKYNDVNGVVTEDMITDEGMIIKKGKKTFHRVVTQ